MKNIFKLLLVSFIIPLLFTSCNDEDYNNWTTQEPTFLLHDTTLGANQLFVSMENNPFVLTWEKASTSAPYSVVVSATEDFASKVELGTSQTTTFKTTIGQLNLAMLQAGLNPFSTQAAYIRIEAGSQVSNAIKFDVTPYPVVKPIITNPTAGSSIILNESAPDATATVVKWNDYASYGVDVKYLVEIATKGSSTYYALGTVTNEKELAVSNLVFDQAVLKTGAVANVSSEIDVRVTASTESTGGNITKVSDVVSIHVTPYVLESWLYVPGAFQGWDPSSAPGIVSATSNGVYVGYINFPSADSEFKITPARNWDNSYGTTNNSDIVYNGGNNLKATNAGYQKLTVDLNNNTFQLEAYSWGLIGSATPGGWDNDSDMEWDYVTQTWVLNNIALTAGEIKFRLNDSWDTNYGDDGANGSLEAGGANIAISEAGNYKIVLDLVNMSYTVTKL